MPLRVHSLYVAVVAASDAVGVITNMVFLFGIMLIVALAFNHVLGTAGVPFFGNRIPVLIGAFTVSAVTLRLAFLIVSWAGVGLQDWGNEMGWIYNNSGNVRLVNEFIAGNPALGVGLIVFSFGASLILGGLGGWLLARIALRMDVIYILILTLSLTDLGCVFGRNITWLGGGTLGLWIFDPVAFLPGDLGVVMAVIVLATAGGVYMLMRGLSDSPWGRLLAATRDNPTTVESVGKDLVAIRGRAVFFASGIMALAGTLYAFYLGFVSESSYHNGYWMFWPLIMILLGGLGSSAGTVIGTVIIIALREAVIMLKFQIATVLFFPVSYLEDILFSILMLIVLIRLPRGLIRERRKQIRGIAYGDIVEEKGSGTA